MPRKELSKKELELYMKHHYGEGIFSDAYDWVKNKAKQLHTYVKDNKVISKGLKSYAESDPFSTAGKLAYLGSYVSDKLGYGKEPMPIIKRAKGKKGGARTKLEKGLLP